jgi:biotin carboxyl carrier protein
VTYEIEIGGRTRRVVARREGRGFAVEMDGRRWRVDVARGGAHSLSLIVDNGDGTHDSLSADVTIAPASSRDQLTVHVGPVPVTVAFNGRRARQRSGDTGASGGGPQRIAAPMPGKVVRVLVKPGDEVAARQPVVVVEAMKMENELRAVRAGTVAEVYAREHMSVEAGALLVVIQ